MRDEHLESGHIAPNRFKTDSILAWIGSVPAPDFFGNMFVNTILFVASALTQRKVDASNSLVIPSPLASFARILALTFELLSRLCWWACCTVQEYDAFLSRNNGSLPALCAAKLKEPTRNGQVGREKKKKKKEKKLL